MSRRWYRHDDRLVFVGWDRQLQQFFLNTVELCKVCEGLGEDPMTEVPCAACMGEGVQQSPEGERRIPASTLDEIAAELTKQHVPFPDNVRADLENDKRTNAGDLVHEYD
jgi:DnaJ-class molecular chaperone